MTKPTTTPTPQVAPERVWICPQNYEAATSCCHPSDTEYIRADLRPTGDAGDYSKGLPEGVKQLIDEAYWRGKKVEQQSWEARLETGEIVATGDAGCEWQVYDHDTAPRDVELLLRFPDGHYQIHWLKKVKSFWFDSEPTHYLLASQIPAPPEGKESK